MTPWSNEAVVSAIRASRLEFDAPGLQPTTPIELDARIEHRASIGTAVAALKAMLTDARVRRGRAFFSFDRLPLNSADRDLAVRALERAFACGGERQLWDLVDSISKDELMGGLTRAVLWARAAS